MSTHLSRAAARRGTTARVETEGPAFFVRVRCRYLEIARETRVVRIDATEPLAAVVSAAIAAVESRWPT